MTNEWKPKRPVVVLAALATVIAVSGCLQEVPIVSRDTGNKTTNMTLEEQREWVGEQFDAAVTASGAAEGWYDIYWKDVFWSADRPEDRELLLGSWFPRKCGLGGRLDESLKNMTADDPLGAAEKVRAFWESDGWTVTDVWSDPSPAEPHFRADREDGAFMGFQASVDGMSLSVYSACSVNHTVMNWQSYVDDEPNEFEEELERRESSAE